MTQSEIILRHLKGVYAVDKEYFTPNYLLQGKELEDGWIGSQGTRRCRELCEQGLIEGKIIDGIRHYRYKQTEAELELQMAKEKIIINRAMSLF